MSVATPTSKHGDPEAAILGGIFLEPSLLDEIETRGLQFRSPQLGAILDAQRTTWAEGESDGLDSITVVAKLDGNPHFADRTEASTIVASILDAVATSVFVREHAGLIEDDYQRRQILSATKRITEAAENLATPVGDLRKLMRTATDSFEATADAKRDTVVHRTGAAIIEALGAGTQEWLVSGMVPLPGVTLLYGEPGSGKGWLAAEYVMIALKQGRPAFWINADQSYKNSVFQVDQCALAHGITREVWLDQTHFFNLREKGHTLTMPHVRRAITEAAEELMPLVTIIDSVTSASGVNIRSEEECTPLILWSAAIAATSQGSVTWIGHNRKTNNNDSDGAVDAAFGSRSWTALVDSVLRLVRVGEEGETRKLTASKVRGSEDGFSIELRLVTRTGIRMHEISSSRNPGTVVNRVEAFVRADPAQSTNTVLRLVKGGKDDVRAALSQLEESGVIENRGDAKGSQWFVVQAGARAPEGAGPPTPSPPQRPTAKQDGEGTAKVAPSHGERVAENIFDGLGEVSG